MAIRALELFDIEVYHFNYRLHDITDWPFDAVEVLCQDSEVVFLGSLKAACSLEKWPEYFGEKVNIVLSMCLDDMAVKGAPKDWSTYFRCDGVHDIALPLEDICVRAHADAAAFSLRATVLLEACISACQQLHQQRRTLWLKESSVRIFMHCVGGINRSAAALCASLMLAHSMSAEEPIIYMPSES